MNGLCVESWSVEDPINHNLFDQVSKFSTVGLDELVSFESKGNLTKVVFDSSQESCQDKTVVIKCGFAMIHQPLK